jgi:small subunit ribosomal protein S8
MSDPIANMLTQINNARQGGKSTVIIPASKQKIAILKVLKDSGYLKEIKYQASKVQRKQSKKLQTVHPFIEVVLEKNDRLANNSIKRISRQGLRRYISAKRIFVPKSGLGLMILSTPQGVMSGKQARKKNLGGEIIAEVS